MLCWFLWRACSRRPSFTVPRTLTLRTLMQNSRRISSASSSSSSSTPERSLANVAYGYMEDVEAPNFYVPEGYCPVQIDECLHARYRIVHKLGHGSFSTAWLALDQTSQEFVAVKVGTADANTREADVLHRLTTVKSLCRGLSMIPLVLDRFTLSSPNGTHPCFVTLAARCSLLDAKKASGPRLFSLDVARSLAAQLCLAVSFVHTQGFVHGGMASYLAFCYFRSMT